MIRGRRSIEYHYPDKCDEFLENYFIKQHSDKILFRALSEEHKVNLSKELVQKLYDNAVNKGLTLHYTELEHTKGDITKLDSYATLKNSIDLLSGIQTKMKEKILGLDTVIHAHDNLIANKANFEQGFRLNNQHVIIFYNNVATALICSVSFLIATTVDYIKDPAGNYQVHFKSSSQTLKGYPTVFLNALDKFNLIARDGSLAKFFALLYGKSSLVESIVAAIGAFVLTSLTIAIVIVPIIREIIFQYYFMRIKIADYLRIQADFLEMNRQKLIGRDDVASKQKKIMDSLTSLADKIDVDQRVSSQNSVREIQDQDKKLNLSNVELKVNNLSSDFQEINVL